MKTKRAFVTGGGTGGHFYPALVVGKKLENEGFKVFYIGSRRGIENKIIPAQTNFSFIKINAAGFRGNLVEKIFSIFLLCVNAIKLFFITLIYNPSLIISTGGYVSAPAVIAGFLCAKKTFLLEQNYKPGKTTRFLSFFSKKIFVSFEDTLKFLPPLKGVFTGNPVREEILKYSKKDAKNELGLDEEKTTVLISGASQGAKSINDAILKILPEWKENNWQIIHLTGAGNYENVERRSKDLLKNSKLKYVAKDYLDDIYLAYASADLIICRSGATTIAEITLRGLPAVLVPYPFAAENHQYYNALFLEKCGAAVIIEDKNLDRDLKNKVENLLFQKDKLDLMSKSSFGLAKPNALNEIMEEIKREIGDRE